MWYVYCILLCLAWKYISLPGSTFRPSSPHTGQLDRQLSLGEEPQRSKSELRLRNIHTWSDEDDEDWDQYLDETMIMSSPTKVKPSSEIHLNFDQSTLPMTRRNHWQQSISYGYCSTCQCPLIRSRRSHDNEDDNDNDIMANLSIKP